MGRRSDSWNGSSSGGANTPVGGKSARREDMGRTKADMRNRLYWEMLVGGLIASTVGSILVDMLFDRLYMDLPNIVLVGISMLIHAALILLTCGMIECQKNGIANNDTAGSIDSMLVRALCGTLIVAVLALGLEFIYELGYVYKGVDFQDYIFVVDDSGSMSSSDPRSKRYSALESLLETMDENNMVGIVRFDDTILDEAAPAVVDDAQRQLLQQTIDKAAITGGTDIQLALERAAQLYGSAKRAGIPSAVVLLSDGGAFVDVPGITQRYKDMGVSICTVALGMGADRNLLQSLADGTGGIMLDVNDADMLKVTYRLLNGGELRRCLLMPRIGADKADVPHMIMSILFMGILGTAISAGLAWIFGWDAGKRQLLVGGCASFVGALIHEIGNNAGLAPRSPMLILFGLVLLMGVFSGLIHTNPSDRNAGPRRSDKNSVLQYQQHVDNKEIQSTTTATDSRRSGRRR